MASKGPAVLRALADPRAIRDSRLYRLLEPLPPETVLNVWAAGDELVRERVERYSTEVSRIAPAVSGRDLIEMGAEPGEAFSAILATARDDRLDGRAVGREAEIANLRRLALKRGLVSKNAKENA
jgi:tRNA nucleotidyltransferase (CCA-adding enzyme)